MEVKFRTCVCMNIKFVLDSFCLKHKCVLLTCLIETVCSNTFFALCLNGETLQLGTYLSAGKTTTGHGSACIWQRKQTARHGKFLIPENGKSERRQMLKKRGERERQDGGNIWRNKTSAKPCDNIKGLEVSWERLEHTQIVTRMCIHV